MVKVTLDDLDFVCNGLYELFVLTHLQGVVLEKPDFVVFESDGVKISHTAAFSYLWEKQYQTLANLKLLIEKDGFSMPLEL